MNHNDARRSVFALLALVSWSYACGDRGTEPLPPETSEPASVTVTPSNASLTAVDATVQLTTDVRDQNGKAVAGAAVTWMSSDTSVAAVNAGGLVTAAGNGRATVTATSGGVSGTASVTVAQAVSAVAVSPDSPTVLVGDTLRMTAEGADANGHAVAGAEFAWSSSDTLVAVVDGSGLVRGVGLGSAMIAAATNGAEGTSEINVDNPDRRVLVTLYMATDGPNWVNNDGWLSDAPLSEWYGVTTDASGRVVQLDLSGDNEDPRYIPHGLSGQIPPELGNLTHLEQLWLDENALVGPIPPELGNLSNLESLKLDANGLTRIPLQLEKLSDLTELDLSWNNIGGRVPPELGNLSNLTSLSLSTNALSGPIPPELGNLSNLTSLSLSRNALSGPIPPELGNLSNLTSLWLWRNNLSGPVPQSFLQIAGLVRFRLSGNSALCIPATPAFRAWLAGIVDHDIEPGNDCNAVDVTVLESLYEVAGGVGWTKSEGWLGDEPVAEWHGIVADTLGRVTQLDLESNALTGFLPGTLGDLVALTDLRISHNALSGRVPLSLTRTRLEVLHYADTNLCVSLEESFQAWLNAIGSVSGARDGCGLDREILETFYEATDGPNWTNSTNWLTDAPLGEWYGVEADDQGWVRMLRLLGNNGLSGPIPSEVGKLASLTQLSLAGSLTGPIPPELGNLANLTELYLSGLFSGPIPPEIGSLSNLTTLTLRGRSGLSGGFGLTGPIPSELGDLSKLTRLTLSGSFTGPIPPEIGSLSNLTTLNLHGRSGLSGGFGLTGPIPSELGDLANLRRMNLYRNHFSSPIPPELGNLTNLQVLWLDANDLTGPIPSDLGSLTNLEYLWLRDNDLSGPVPAGLSGMSNLVHLVLTNNSRMAGPLPADITKLRWLQVLVAGGTDLCAPAEASFRRWLRRLDTSRVKACIDGNSSAYLVQAIQSREFPVPLVAGERAMLRVFPTAKQITNAGIPEVRARFFREGHETYVTNIPGKSGAIPRQVNESSLAGSANAEIPGEIVQPGLEIVIEIDPGGTLDPALLVTRRIPKTGRLAVEVHAMAPFDLTLIPFVWTQTQDSSRVELVRAIAADPESHETLQPARTLLPIGDIRVTAHDPVLSSSNDAHSLLRETTAIRAMEGGTGYYMGILPSRYSGNAAGVARRGGKESVSSTSPYTIAHELGHNLSLGHAPCGNPGLEDGWYPYSDGSIGAWGYDFRGGGTVVPPSHKDLMSYCGPSWVSDYNFTKALYYRPSNTSGAAAFGSPTVYIPTRSILLWGGTDADGVPHLEPAFLVDAQPVLPDAGGEYHISGWADGDGTELFSFTFGMPEVADGDGSFSFAFVLPGQDGWEDALTSITLSGPQGSFTLDRDTDVPMAILRDPRTGQVRGFLRGPPPPSQAPLDETGRAAGLGLEVLFSRGIPDAEAWRR